MIGRKLVVLQGSSEIGNIKEDPYLEEWKHATVKNIKKYSYLLLVAIIRIYVHSSNFIKLKYQELKLKIKNRFGKNKENEEAEKEASKFLKMITDYKHKIRKIRRQIKEEEEI
jgi:hypothetical protein